jgi:hypothetical protein
MLICNGKKILFFSEYYKISIYLLTQYIYNGKN